MYHWKSQENIDNNFCLYTSLLDVASWREGGGRAVPQLKSEEPTPNSTSSSLTETQLNGPPTSGGSGGGVVAVADVPQPLPPPRPGSGHGLPHGSLPMGPPMGMPPPPPQYRGMMPPYVSIFFLVHCLFSLTCKCEDLKVYTNCGISIWVCFLWTLHWTIWSFFFIVGSL